MHFLSLFRHAPCIVPTRSLDGTSDRATTLLDFQRRPAPLPLGYAFREGQRNVARRRRETGCDPRIETGAQGRPGAVLSLRTRAVALLDCGSDARSLSGSA